MFAACAPGYLTGEFPGTLLDLPPIWQQVPQGLQRLALLPLGLRDPNAHPQACAAITELLPSPSIDFFKIVLLPGSGDTSP